MGRRIDRQKQDAGRKGAAIRWARERARRAPLKPYGEPFLAFLEAIGRGGPSRVVWRVFWKAADGLPLDADEFAIFRCHTGRETVPSVPARECWLPAGRRGGKSENMVARATWRATSRHWREELTLGEVGVIPLIASDREQARNSLAYLKGLARLPLVAPYVLRVLRDSVEFRTGAVVKVATASWRSTRGFTMLDAILEECAFYTVEGSANPDEEILTAIRPALLTVPGARIYGISSPYARRGILWKAYEQHWGQDESDVLVFSADSLSLNPTLNPRAIAREFEADPLRAASEYGRDRRLEFRRDVEAFLSVEAVEAVVQASRPLELPAREGVHYVAFTDPSGGSRDSWTLAVAHLEDGRAVLDVVRERRPPFSPDVVVHEYAALVKAYRVMQVTGDKYAGEFPRELFRKQGIEYRTAQKTKGDYYRELLAPVRSSASPGPASISKPAPCGSRRNRRRTRRAGNSHSARCPDSANSWKASASAPVSSRAVPDQSLRMCSTVRANRSRISLPPGVRSVITRLATLRARLCACTSSADCSTT